MGGDYHLSFFAAFYFFAFIYFSQIVLCAGIHARKHKQALSSWEGDEDG